MDAPRFQRAFELFETARHYPSEERDAYLAEVCSDEDLRREVQSLLAHHEHSWGALNEPIVGSDEPSSIPKRIGAYTILDILGEGGMGVVYLAEQDHPKRAVALKLMRRGLFASGDLRRRFEFEIQALGRLHHPGIAQIYDAGKVEIGPDDPGARPYFAMEYIEGTPLTRYARTHDLDGRARLDLIVSVCNAVAHAHEHGVIHRDLKPANILVDETGQPKVLDFGVARATDADLRVTSMRTEVGQLVGTLPYMSPEQVQGRSDHIDYRSDVYALGVLCFELLSDRLPHDLTDKSIAEAARIIRDDDPSALSSVSRTYRGDLDTIVAKALEKDPARRYQSAAELGRDIQRFLDNQPIVARPPSASYRLRKFAARNQAFVAGVVTTFVALIIGLITTTNAMFDAQAQRERVLKQAEVTQAVNDFLIEDLLAQASPRNEPDRDIKVRTLLDRAAEGIESRFPDEPLIAASIRRTIGDTYRTLGLSPEAEPHLAEALRLHRATLGDRDQETLVSILHLAAVHVDLQDFETAVELYVEALDAQREVLGERHEHTLTTLSNLGGLYLQLGRFEDAEGLLIDTLALRRQILEPFDLRTATTLNNLGAVYNQQGRYAEAEPLHVEALEIRTKTGGPDHPDTLESLGNLGWLYDKQGRTGEAVDVYETLLESQRRVLGDEHNRTLMTRSGLASFYRRQGRIEESNTERQAVLAIQRRVLGEEHVNTLISRLNLAMAYLGDTRYDDAEVESAGLPAAFARAITPEHPLVGVAQVAHGEALMKLERFDDATSELLSAHALLEAAVGPDHAYTINAATKILNLYEATGDEAQAATWRSRIPDEDQ